MRFLYLFISLILLTFSCKKDTTPGSTPPPPPPPSGGGGSTGKTTITNISPLVAYGGDLITITGTGFSADKTKDTVGFGVTVGSTFNYGGPGGGINFKVQSATATEIKFVLDSALNISYLNAGFKYALAINTPEGKAFTPDTLELRLPLLYSMTNSGPGYTNCFSIFTDDSIFLSGYGLFPPLTFTINGKPVQMISDNNHGLSARGYIPKDFYGQTDPPPGCDGSKLYDIKCVNGDGKTLTRQAYIYEGPASHFGYQIDQSTYYLSNSNQAIIHLTGYALRDDIYIAVSTRDLADQSTTSKLISAGVPAGFPDAHDITLDLGALPKPKSSAGVIVSINTQAGSIPPVGGFGFGGSFLLLN